MTKTLERQMSLFPAGERCLRGGPRAVSHRSSTADARGESSAPSYARPQAGDLLSDLDDLDPHDLAFLQVARRFGCADGLREDLAERRHRTRIDDARKAMEAVVTAEADRIAAEAAALRQKQVDDYRAFVDDALSYLYE